MNTTTNVKRLPRDPGPAGWNAILPEQDSPRALEDNQTADWLVIGAGFAGLSAARRLAQLCPGDRVVVLEATRVASGPAGRNSGFMIDLPHDLASDNYGGSLDKDRNQIAANRAAIAFAREAATEYALPQEAFAESGKINAAATPRGLKHNADYATHLSALGEPHEMLDAQSMHRITGTEYYRGGLYTPGTVMLQPALYVRGLAHGLKSGPTGNRVAIFENSPVVALHANGNGWIAETPKGSINAPKVILAVNGHVESFGHFNRRLVHIFTYASMTEALTADDIQRLGGEPVWGATPADPMGTTVRRISGTGGDRIVIRNRFTYDPSMELPEGRIETVGRDHDRAFIARFPMLAHVQMEYRWGGRLCLSRNNVAAFGEIDHGLYSACCQNGLGTVQGTFNGMLTADLATGHSSPLLETHLEHAAPSRLPPEPIAALGATATIRWAEYKAGKEL
ncbi:MAG: FAD-binding oxidoreductase [Pseudomonadota bacterium]